jgi:NAD(P)-dependent dehydrogenase (short-subunit alcohol dehydrogenase family)
LTELGIDIKCRGNDTEALDRDLLDCFNTNVIGNIHLFNLYVPLVLKGRVKKVIAISTGMADNDLVAKYDLDPAAPYSISKAALNAAVAKFAAQYRKDGVLFMSICPGVVATEMNNGKANSMQSVLLYANS